MDKINITVSPENWGNLVTKYPPDSKKVGLGDFTEGTKNLDTDVRGIITKRKGSVLYNQTPLSAPIKDQYEAIFTDGTRHLLVVEGGNLNFSTGDNLFTLVTAGYSPFGNFEFATTQNRIYFGNGIDAPQVYDRTTSYGGVSYTAPQTKAMGAQAPVAAPTFGADTAGGAVPAGAHTYKVTFLYYDSEESNGGPATGVHTVSNPNNTVNLTAVPTGGYGVTARHIYRDDNDGNYVRVGTINDNTTTIFSDTTAAGTFPIPLDHFTPPNFSMITLWLDRLWVSRVAGDPYTLFFSDPGFPDIYPDTNFIICNQQDPIEATIVYFDRLIIFNKKSMGQIIGSTKDTFRYSDIQGSVGCVDNRSIQIRVVNGVPILVWLSDRGFYSYDGNSVNYLSDPIEDQVNFNIQQSSQKKNKNVQSTQADFQGGTYTDGIDLDSVPGSITTIDPVHTWDDEADWEGGSSLTNISTNDGSNTLKVPLRFTIPYYSQILLAGGSTSYGTFSGVSLSGEVFNLPISVTFTEISLATHPTFTEIDAITPSNPGTGPLQSGQYFVQKFITPNRAGSLTRFRVMLRDRVNNGNAENGTFVIFTDLLGTPNTLVSDFGSWTVPNLSTTTVDTGTINISLAANTTYWIGIKNNAGLCTPQVSGSVSASTPLGIKKFISGAWSDYTPGNGMVAIWNYCAAAVGKSGQWISPIHDTFSDFVSTTLNIAHTGSFPSTAQCSGAASTSSDTIVEGSNSPTFNITEDASPVSETVVNLNGNSNVSISGKRYWRVRIVLNTTDDRIAPSVGVPTLTFSTTGIWISETIDASSDVTDFTNLDTIFSAPAGTSVTFDVSTSNDDIIYPDGFVPFGTEVTRRYIKVRATLTTDTIDTITPSVSSITLKWSLTSVFTSSTIDTGVAPPAGWDIFQSTFSTNGGTVQFEMRSSSTLVDIAATGTVTVFDYTMLSGAILTVDGTPLTEGIDWTAAVSNDATADSLASAINALLTVNAANPPANVITVMAAVAGSAGNAITLATSDPVNLIISGATLAGGADSLDNSTFFPVVSGTFPNNVPVFQFTQWRVTLTATANNKPLINDVTISWFIELITSIRVASLFYNGRYYLSSAEFNQTVNNIIFVLDLDGRWRIYRDLAISSFSYFFNLPYWGSATEGSIFRFLEGSNDNGISIELDIRTRAFDYSTRYQDNSDLIKIPLEFILQGRNTGAEFQVSYSNDEGQTFTPMILNSGATTFTSSVDGRNFYVLFRANPDASSGRTIMYRILSGTDFPVEIQSIKISALIRLQSTVITG